MTIEINLKIEQDFIPINLCTETARYLLALAGIQDATAFIKSRGDNNHDVASDNGHSINESDNDRNNNPITSVPHDGVEVDVIGVPWDYRIHSSSKNKTADGKWKMKRNISEKTAEKINENNKTALAAPKLDAPVVPPPPVQIDLFPKFMTIITEAISRGKTNHLAINKMLQNYGIPDVISVNLRQDLIPVLITEIEKL